MKLVASVLLTLLFLAVAHAEKLQDYRLALNLSANADKACTAPQLNCGSCTCILNSGNSHAQATATACSSSLKKCVNGACLEDADPFCDEFAALDFPCKSVGVFPDPFHCNRFVMCVDNNGLKPYVSTCAQGYGFNIANDLCDVKLTDGVCPAGKYPVPLCHITGQSEALPGKPAEYYLCEQYSESKDVLYPFLHVCLGGVPYANYQCGDTDVIIKTED